MPKPSHCQLPICDRGSHSRIKGEGLWLCKVHYEQERTGGLRRCASCEAILPVKRGRGDWCGDQCQLQIKFEEMRDRATAVLPPRGLALRQPCLLDSRTTAKGYPDMYARLESVGKQVWLGHRLAWILANEMQVVPAGMDLDHICQRPACFEPSHLQLLTRAAHAVVTWGRYDIREVTERRLKQVLGGIPDGSAVDVSLNWNGHLVRIKPATERSL